MTANTLANIYFQPDVCVGLYAVVWPSIDNGRWNCS